MYVVIIREKDGTLNVIGPFWHKNAADEFCNTLPDNAAESIHPVTDRDKFSHAER